MEFARIDRLPGDLQYVGRIVDGAHANVDARSRSANSRQNRIDLRADAAAQNCDMKCRTDGFPTRQTQHQLELRTIAEKESTGKLSAVCMTTDKLMQDGPVPVHQFGIS